MLRALPQEGSRASLVTEKGVFAIDSDGWVKGAQRFASPHFNERPPADIIPHTVVLHNISLPPQQFGTGFVRDLFMGTLDTTRDASLADLKGLRVSSHFFIDRTGALFNL